MAIRQSGAVEARRSPFDVLLNECRLSLLQLRVGCEASGGLALSEREGGGEITGT